MKTSKKMSVSFNDKSLTSCQSMSVRACPCSSVFKSTIAKVAIIIGTVVSPFLETTLQAFEITDQELVDGKTMTYVCVSGRVTDSMDIENPARGYKARRGIKGAVVWLKRNPELRAVTDEGGLFEIIVENGVLAPGIRGIDDLVYVWKPGYKLERQSILKATGVIGANGVKIYKRDSQIRISDYDATRYFPLTRTNDWNLDNIQKMIKTNSTIPKEYNIPIKPYPIPFELFDGRVVSEININGTVKDLKTGQPIPYAGVWLKRNPTILVRTDKNGRYKISMSAVGLRPRSKDLTDSICVSAGAYKPIEISLENYEQKIDCLIEKHNITETQGLIPLINIPASQFRFGIGHTQGGGDGKDSIGDIGCYQSYPVRTVSLPAFSIGKYPITIGQYQKVFDWAKNNGYQLMDVRGISQFVSISYSYDDDVPLSGWQWIEMIKWCNAASEMEGKTPCYYTPAGDVFRYGRYDEPQVKWKVNGYRLPTKAEWEYAATAGTHFNQFWAEGYDTIRDYGHIHFDNTEKGLRADTAFPVGKKKPNPFGLHDLIGQVAEKCWDWNGPFNGLDTYHPKGATKAETVAWWRPILYGRMVALKDGGTWGGWGVGPIWGDLDWGDIRIRPSGYTVADSGYNSGLRVVISSERGDENIKLPVLEDRQRNLPVAVDLNKITEKLDMASIPAGSIQLGGYYRGDKKAPAWAKKSTKKKLVIFDERPEYLVNISEFKIAKYETTFEQWESVYNWAIKNGYDFDNKGSIGHSSSDDKRHPVTEISWNDVIKWCNAASEKEGLQPCYYVDDLNKIVYRQSQIENPNVNWNANGYRLPTEAEWEYAACGGEDTAFYWGDYLDLRYAWFGGWSGDSCTDYPILQNYAKSRPAGKLGLPIDQPKPNWASHPVGQKIGNRFGLYDTFGNVWEMCWDLVAPYSMRMHETINPKGPKSKENIAYFIKMVLPKIQGHLSTQGAGQIPQSKEMSEGVRALRGCCYKDSGVRINHPISSLASRSGIKHTDKNILSGFRVAKNK